MKLGSFEVESKEKIEKFEIYGELEIVKGQERGKEYLYPQFYDLVAKKITEGKEEPYIPDGVYWNGEIASVEDMIGNYLADLIRYGTTYKKVYLCVVLQKLVDSYHLPDDNVITVNNLLVPRWILMGDMLQLYELEMVTNKYIYYVFCDDALIMLDQKHDLVSGNYFASVGYGDSVDKIKTGEEALLWGTFSEAV